jgi:hypothetical protein
MELNCLSFALQANVYEFVARNSAEIRRFQARATIETRQIPASDKITKKLENSTLE